MIVGGSGGERGECIWMNGDKVGVHSIKRWHVGVVERRLPLRGNTR